ncbi:MAG: hypothetical protein NVS3B20_11090 [Polyangiales bacterium]
MYSIIMNSMVRAALLLLPVIAAMWVPACEPLPPAAAAPVTSAVSESSTGDPATASVSSASNPKAEDQLIKEDLVVGNGETAIKGAAVSVHYVGTLLDGTKFDSSLDRGKPFVFTVGKGSVIRGWDEGVLGMREGGKRKLVVPPHLAYGDRGQPPTIPPHATLVFEIELLRVVP